MDNNNNNRFAYVVGVVLALALVVTITATSYAYFTANISNSKLTTSTVVTTGSMEIEFSDGDQIKLEKTLPGNSVEKTFNIKNVGSVSTTYDIYLSDLINSFEDNADLVYTLTSELGANVNETVVPSSSSKIVSNQNIEPNVTHSYKLKIEFKETNDNQDDNKGKKFSTVVRVNEVQDVQIPYSIISGDLETVGSEVCIREECFYVIGQEDSNHVKLFSKYNLGVGNGFETPTNKQNVTAIGRGSSQPYPGSVVFSKTNYWADGDKIDSRYTGSTPYVYTNEKENGQYIASIAKYVEDYVEYLTSLGVNVSGRLLNNDEYQMLNYYPSYPGPEWLNSTTYWTGFAYSFYSIGSVGEYSLSGTSYNNQYGGGVRPVIILEK